VYALERKRTVTLAEGVERVYCYHVRKTGGTSLAHSFLGLGGEDPGLVEKRMTRPPFCTRSGAYRFVYQDLPLLRRGIYQFGYSHKCADVVRLPPNTFRVTILRDPIDRVVSLYRYLIDPRADEGQAFKALPLERAWVSSGFPEFLARASRAQLLNQLYTFSRSGDVEQAARRILSCDRVLFTHELDTGIADLGDTLGLPLRTRRARISATDYSPSESEAAQLRTLLDPEYQLLELVAQGAQPAGKSYHEPARVLEGDAGRLRSAER
jgi:hypothetical protein